MKNISTIEKYMTQRNVYQWVKEFPSGTTNVANEDCFDH